MKIAITGGAGFIGAHLTRAYLDAGHDVLVIDNLAHGFRQDIDSRARFYQIDIRDEKLWTILQMERPDIVSHYAAQQAELPGEQTLRDADVNIRGLLNVLDSSVNASVRKLIFASGGATMYGHVPTEALPVSEETPLSPYYSHDVSKAAGEAYIRYYTRQYRLKHTILRYANVYGNRDSAPIPHPLCYFLSLLSEQRRPVIRGTGKEIQDHIFIDDVIQANLCALKHGDNSTLHISTGQGCTLNRLYSLVAQALGSKLEPIYLTLSPLLTPSPVALDNTQAQRILGWYPRTTLEEGVCQMIARLKARQEKLAIGKERETKTLPKITREAAARVTQKNPLQIAAV